MIIRAESKFSPLLSGDWHHGEEDRKHRVSGRTLLELGIPHNFHSLVLMFPKLFRPVTQILCRLEIQTVTDGGRG
jgi:hypothetical protein